MAQGGGGELADPINFDAWIERMKPELKPPVANKLLFGAGQLKVMVVGGPNTRSDFHIEEGEEWFYMIEGDMELGVMEHGRHRVIPIREGESFLLPRRIPHSPQRQAGSIGLVIERERSLEEQDGLRWYVRNDRSDPPRILYEEWFPCRDLGTQVKEGIERFMASEEHRTGEPKKDYDEAKDAPYQTNKETTLVDPIPLRPFVEEQGEGVGTRGFVYGGGEGAGPATLQPDAEFSIEIKRGRSGEADAWRGKVPEGEVFFWQQAGTLTLCVEPQGSDRDPKEVTVGPNHVFLLPQGNHKVTAEVRAASVTRLLPERRHSSVTFCRHRCDSSSDAVVVGQFRYRGAERDCRLQELVIVVSREAEEIEGEFDTQHSVALTCLPPFLSKSSCYPIFSSMPSVAAAILLVGLSFVIEVESAKLRVCARGSLREPPRLPVASDDASVLSEAAFSVFAERLHLCRNGENGLIVHGEYVAPGKASEWGRLELRVAEDAAANADVHGEWIAAALGYAEGFATVDPIDHFLTLLRKGELHELKVLPDLRGYVETQWRTLLQRPEVQEAGASEENSLSIWSRRLIAQWYGLAVGHAAASETTASATASDVLLLSFDAELYDVESAVLGAGRHFHLPVRGADEVRFAHETSFRDPRFHAARSFSAAEWQTLARRSRCSALVSMDKKTGDVVVGHATWASFVEMPRLWKRVQWQPHGTLSYSSYPGFLGSTDDWFMTPRGFVVTETSLSAADPSEMSPMDPSRGTPTWFRALAASWHSTSPAEWARDFSRGDSGMKWHGSAGFAQWLIVDLTVGDPAFWIVEESMQRSVVWDATKVLREVGLFPSMNRPIHPAIRRDLGYPDEETTECDCLPEQEHCVAWHAGARQKWWQSVGHHRHDGIPSTSDTTAARYRTDSTASSSYPDFSFMCNPRTLWLVHEWKSVRGHVSPQRAMAWLRTPSPQSPRGAATSDPATATEREGLSARFDWLPETSSARSAFGASDAKVVSAVEDGASATVWAVVGPASGALVPMFGRGASDDVAAGSGRPASEDAGFRWENWPQEGPTEHAMCRNPSAQASALLQLQVTRGRQLRHHSRGSNEGVVFCTLSDDADADGFIDVQELHA